MAVLFIPYKAAVRDRAQGFLGLSRKFGIRLKDIPLETCRVITGSLAPEQKTLADLGPEDHVLSRSHSWFFASDMRGMRAKVSVMLYEPPAVQPRHYRSIRLVGRRFHRVLSYDPGVLARLPNARWLAHGGASFPPPPPELIPEKTRRLSLITSGKRDLAGHRLRLDLAEWCKTEAPDVDLLGRAFQPLEDKSAGLAPYYFSVTVENSRSPGYFTEKLIDCFLCHCIPVYWGAPDIADYFDPRGMILCDDKAALQAAIRQATPEDYQERLPYLRENAKKAREYLYYNQRGANALLAENTG